MAQPDPGQKGTFALSSKLIISFASICAVLAAIGSFIFLSLRSLELLDRHSTFSALDEVGVLRSIAKDADLLHAEVFRSLTTASPAEKLVHRQIVRRLENKNTQRLTHYAMGHLDEEERRLHQEVVKTREQFLAQTRKLLASDEEMARSRPALDFVSPQLTAYQTYQKNLGTLIHFEEAKNREMIVATSARIAQTKSIGNILLCLALGVGAWTGLILFRMIAALKRDKARLENEVAQREQAGIALRESEARHRLLLERIPDAVYVIADERIVFANEAAQK